LLHKKAQKHKEAQETQKIELIHFVFLVLLCGLTSGGDDRIRTCEGLLTLNGLANRRLQPLGHISVP
jgi:hypothetical protein